MNRSLYDWRVSDRKMQEGIITRVRTQGTGGRIMLDSSDGVIAVRKRMGVTYG